MVIDIKYMKALLGMQPTSFQSYLFSEPKPADWHNQTVCFSELFRPTSINQLWIRRYMTVLCRDPQPWNRHHISSHQANCKSLSVTTISSGNMEKTNLKLKFEWYFGHLWNHGYCMVLQFKNAISSCFDSRRMFFVWAVGALCCGSRRSSTFFLTLFLGCKQLGDGSKKLQQQLLEHAWNRVSNRIGRFPVSPQIR